MSHRRLHIRLSNINSSSQKRCVLVAVVLFFLVSAVSPAIAARMNLTNSHNDDLHPVAINVATTTPKLETPMSDIAHNEHHAPCHDLASTEVAVTHTTAHWQHHLVEHDPTHDNNDGLNCCHGQCQSCLMGAASLSDVAIAPRSKTISSFNSSLYIQPLATGYSANLYRPPNVI